MPEDALDPSPPRTRLTRRTVLRSAAWSVPVVVAAAAAPLASASGEGLVFERSLYAAGGCDPFDVTLVAASSDGPAAGANVTLALPAGWGWKNPSAPGTSGRTRLLTTDAQGRAVFTGIRPTQTPGTYPLQATWFPSPSSPPAVATAQVQITSAGADAVWGRQYNLQSVFPPPRTIVDFAVALDRTGDPVDNSTGVYNHYAAADDANVWVYQAPTDGTSGTWTIVPGRGGSVLVAADDQPGGVGLYTSDGTAVFDAANSSIGAPAGGGIVALAVGYTSQWNVYVALSDATVWQKQGGGAWTRITALDGKGIRFVAFDTLWDGTTRFVAASATTLYNGVGGVIATVPAGGDVIDLAVEIQNFPSYVVVTADGKVRRYNFSGSWDVYPHVDQTHVAASSSWTASGFHAFLTVGRTTC